MKLSTDERIRLIEWGRIMFRHDTLDWTLKDDALLEKLRRSVTR